MKRLATLALLALFAGPAAAAEAQQFNLMCSGRTTGERDSRDARLLDKPPARWYRMFRIDVAAGRWCEGDCAATEALTASDEHPGKLVFTDTVALIDRHTRERRSATYDPATRSYAALHTVQDLALGFYKMSNETTASCEAGPFSGFPSP